MRRGWEEGADLIALATRWYLVAVLSCVGGMSQRLLFGRAPFVPWMDGETRRGLSSDELGTW